MKTIEDPISLFEEWLECMRNDFEIVNFKDFRKEMYDFVSEVKSRDVSDILFIVNKYRKQE